MREQRLLGILGTVREKGYATTQELAEKHQENKLLLELKLQGRLHLLQQELKNLIVIDQEQSH